MKVRSATTQPLTTRTPTPVRAPPAKRLGHDLASSFEGRTRPGKRTFESLAAQARKLFAGDFKHLRAGLRAGDSGAIKGAIASIGSRLGISASNFTGQTPHQLLTDFGRQVVHPDFAFNSGRDLGPLRDGVCATWGRTGGGKINDPDPSLRT